MAERESLELSKIIFKDFLCTNFCRHADRYRLERWSTNSSSTRYVITHLKWGNSQRSTVNYDPTNSLIAKQVQRTGKDPR